MALSKETKAFFDGVHHLIMQDRERALEIAHWINKQMETAPEVIMLNPGLLPATMKALQGSTDQLIKLLQILQGL